ncbi:hypothetical protein CMO90_00205 [Candidatus Woesearchaeota archaeon]|jgi:ASC-1-like (ASCH) protein|nr:hypothetical protein [Candidatus Woesearchaeota archaeon]|tara:strand:+ start:2566 stop:3291 length:726 start_codon:yes stop_codon:yes gene_type:complete
MVEYKLFKIWPEHLREMRIPGRKVIDIRVPDPKDKEKDFSKLKIGDILFFRDTNNRVLKTKVMKDTNNKAYVHHYSSVEELLIHEGVENVWPDVKDFDEAVRKCLQFPNYRKRVEKQGIYAIGMEKLLIYVAGPYSAKRKFQKKRNIMHAVKTGIEISKCGYIPFVPHSALANWEKLGLTEGECIALENDYIRKADAFFFIRPSPGTNNERRLALELDLDIFTSLENLKYWKPVNRKQLGF